MLCFLLFRVPSWSVAANRAGVLKAAAASKPTRLSA